MGIPVKSSRRKRRRKGPVDGRNRGAAASITLLVIVLLLLRQYLFVRSKTNTSDINGVQSTVILDQAALQTVPIAVFVGRRDLSYARRLWKSIAQAIVLAKAPKTACFILNDSGIHVSDQMFFEYTSVVCSEVFVIKSEVSAGVRYKDVSSNRGTRMKKVWTYMMAKVWSHTVLSTYSGDILFLEDDLILARDFLFVLQFLVDTKNGNVASNEYASEINVVTLGGWVRMEC